MKQRLAWLIACSVLAACAAPQDNSWWDGWGPLAAAGAEHQLDFSWELAGSPAVAPVQVFSTSQQLWLQFVAPQPIPALFAVTDGRLRPLQALPRGQYHVVDEGIDIVLLQRNQEQAWAYKAAAKPQLQQYLQQGIVHSLSRGAPSTGTAVPLDNHSAGVFTTTSADTSLRALLQRWAHAEGWVFEPEHWAIAVEVPLSGPFAYKGEFTVAVQQLLLSTQLSAYPLRPCFYSNRVLRVIPLAQSCVSVPTKGAL